MATTDQYVPAQTFIIDPASVKLAEQVSLTSIDVFFKSKPVAIGNQSGVIEPGVNLYIVPTAAGGIPNYTNLSDYISSRKEFSEIASSVDASVVTKFTFSTPVPLRTGVEYAFIIKADSKDEAFSLWAASEGEINVDTKGSSSGIAGKYQGKYFELSGTNVNWQPLPYKNLKFRVYVARYAYDGVIPAGSFPRFELNIKNYEYVTFTKSSGTFFNGEYVYKRPTSATGSVSVIAGTNIVTTSGGGFSGLFIPGGDDSYIVVNDTSRVNVRKIINVSADNNTAYVDENFSFSNSASDYYHTAVARAYIVKNSQLVPGAQNFMVLSDSNANSSLRFTNNSVIIGETSGATISDAYFNDILVHSTEPHTYINTPAQTAFTTRQEFKYTSNDGGLNGIVSSPATSFNVKMYENKNLDTAGKPIMLKSRSNEVSLRNFHSTDKNESSKLVFDITSSNDFTSPEIDYNATDVFFKRYIVNNDTTNENTKNGSAYSKHITSKINFAQGRQAEDLLVYLQAYKPSGTNIKVYAKIYNSDDSDYFDDKDWSELIETSGNKYSSLSDLNDFVEYTYGFKTSPDADTFNDGSAYIVPGYVTVTSGSKTVTAISNDTDFTDVTSGLSPGDLIAIYPQLFPEKCVIYSVYSVDSGTQITLNTEISSSDATALGSSSLQIRKMKYKHQAFTNMRNNNTVRYFNSNMTLFDKYDTFSLKIVFQSGNQFIIPKVSNVRAIGVSA